MKCAPLTSDSAQSRQRALFHFPQSRQMESACLHTKPFAAGIGRPSFRSCQAGLLELCWTA